MNHSAEPEKHVGRIDETPTRDVPSRKRNVELASAKEQEEAEASSPTERVKMSI